MEISSLIRTEKQNISQIISNVNLITDNLKENNNKINQILENAADISDINCFDINATIENAKESLQQFNLILYDIQNGDGTLTHLIKDSTMYLSVNKMIDEASRLIENIKTEPKRYVQFSIFGGKDKSILDSRDEKLLKKFAVDSLSVVNFIFKSMLGQLIFVVVLIAGFGFFSFNISKIRKNIMLGKPLDRSDQKLKRIKTTLLIALGQKKMFQRVLPALFHLFIYVAFLFTSTELIEIIIDGVTGSHRFFWPILGSVYVLLINMIEILSVLAFVATLVFLARRNLLTFPDFKCQK